MSIAVLNKKPDKVKKSQKGNPIKTPKSLEDDARVSINKIVREVNAELRAISDNAKTNTPEQTAALLNDFKRRWRVIIEPIADKISKEWVKAIDENNYEKTMAMLRKAFGIEISTILEDKDIADTLEAMRLNMVNLIVTIPEESLKRVALRIYENYQGIPMPENRTLQQQISQEFKTTYRQAKVIARDQTAKINASLNKIRQQKLGVDIYIWQTMRDSRVVGKPGGLYPKGNDAHGNHYIMQGLYCKYSDPTVFSTDGKTWRKRTATMPKGEPGTDIQCRCFAEPVLYWEAVKKNLVVA